MCSFVNSLTNSTQKRLFTLLFCLRSYANTPGSVLFINITCLNIKIDVKHIQVYCCLINQCRLNQWMQYDVFYNLYSTVTKDNYIDIDMYKNCTAVSD